MRTTWWLWPAIAVVSLDQATKLMAYARLAPGVPETVFPWLNWTLIFNRGVAFSIFNAPGDWQRWIFSGLAFVVAVFIAFVLVRSGGRMNAASWGFALILGGAVGNLIDRVRLGYVVDFIDAYYGAWHWPAFNIADSAISTGVALLLVASLFAKESV